jgi:hypothetical protein
MPFKSDYQLITSQTSNQNANKSSDEEYYMYKVDQGDYERITNKQGVKTSV